MIHIYPGLGATASMYGKPWKEDIIGIYHDWPQWKGETTIGELAERIIVEHNIEKGDVLIGSSLGGMVAGEIARKIDLGLMVLIGSATNRDEISKILEVLHPLIDYSPIAFIKACAGKLPSELAQMFSESDPQFIRAISKAIFKWQGVDTSTRMIRIHGSYDQVIPPPQAVDYLIPGGHLLAMTHPEACIDKLKDAQVGI